MFKELKTINDYDNDELFALIGYAIYRPTRQGIADRLEKYRHSENTKILGHFNKERPNGVIVYRCEQGKITIENIGVKETERYKGIGRKLIKKVITRENWDTIEAETDHDAVGFYKSMGFRIKSIGEKYPGVERFICLLSQQQSQICAVL